MGDSSERFVVGDVVRVLTYNGSMHQLVAVMAVGTRDVLAKVLLAKGIRHKCTCKVMRDWLWVTTDIRRRRLWVTTIIIVLAILARNTDRQSHFNTWCF
jgi:hypothetical protein